MKAVIIDFNRTLFNPDKNEFFDGVFDLLKCLKERQWKLALISVENEERLNKIGPISSFFEIIKVVEEKNVQNFGEIITILRVNPNEILVIGDRIKEEITIGKKLGMKALWLKKGKFAEELPTITEENPDFTFANLQEIISFLNNNEL